VRALRRPLLASVLFCLSCTAKPTAASLDPSAAGPTGTSNPSEPSTCGHPELTLGSHGFIPHDARLAASVRLDDEELDEALAHLAALESPHPLPIVVATTLSHLQTQVHLLRPVLRSAGFDPAELLLVTTKNGDQAWLWRSTCDLVVARANVETAWNVRMRETTGGPVGSPVSQTPGAFAYDVLFLPGELVALVPAGNASPFRLWLDGVTTSPPPGDENLAPGARLEQMQPAAVGVVMTGTGLLPSDAGPRAGPTRQLRATARGLEIGGTTWRPPP